MNTFTDAKQLRATPWIHYLDQRQQELALLAFELYQRETDLKSQLADYSFIIFPMSKAYEGFLKKFLLDVGLIDEKTFTGRRFRIGRALNPDIKFSQRDEYWLYDDVEYSCGQEVARQIWETWLKCRNRVFHYFPNRDTSLSLQDSREYLDLIATTIERALFCKPSLMEGIQN